MCHFSRRVSLESTMKIFQLFAVFALSALFVHCERIVNIHGGASSVQIYQTNDREVSASTTTEKFSLTPKSSSRREETDLAQPTSQPPTYSFNFNGKVFESGSNNNVLSIGNHNAFHSKSMEQSLSAYSTETPSLAESTISSENDESKEDGREQNFEAEEIEADLFRNQRRQNNLG